MIGQGVVDGVDLGVGQQFIIRTVCLWNAQRTRRFSGLPQVARGDGGDLRILAPLHGGNDLLDGDQGCAQNAPAYFWHVEFILLDDPADAASRAQNRSIGSRNRTVRIIMTLAKSMNTRRMKPLRAWPESCCTHLL